MQSVKVVIVGGGAAGLGAAKTFGLDVDYLLVEAQNYLGGRIRTVDVAPNVAVDLGAQFIHGKVNNIVYDVCQNLNCIMPVSEETANDTLVLTSNQTVIDSNLFDKATVVWQAILEEAAAFFEKKTRTSHHSLSDYLVEHFKKRLSIALGYSDDIIDAFIDYFNQIELIDNGCSSLSDLSLADYGSFEYLDGDYAYEFQNGGYRSFIAYMKSFLPDEKRVRLNSEVVRVKYLQDSHRLQVDIRDLNHSSENEITTILCDHVIWTSSLGYLKENFSSIFATEKELLEQKRQAVENLGFDTVNKVVLVYEKSFWPEDVKEMILLHTQKSLPIPLSESLNDLTDIRTIVEAIHRYDVLPSTDTPVLICWFGGPAAVLIENFSNEIIGQICHEVLCYFLNISSKSNLPINIVKSGWHTNRFVRGSYSYYSTKSTKKDGELLSTPYAPDGIPRIQFAGEATHEKFYSTVHGALESGIRESTKLLSVIKK
ncbi:unnamed protein product [Adineta ricciae]|uniref:Amine oxidase domain-containing protein n=1 Tax=Adineta ricciae TaxID=249248 RepID=A0A813RLJ5_ADIRI|nr:unnamed protein product [Adineta ricciae]